MDAGVCFVFKNESNDQLKIEMTFNGLGNLKIRQNKDDATQAELIIAPNSSLPFFLVPINPGEDTQFRTPNFNIEKFDGDCEAQID